MAVDETKRSLSLSRNPPTKPAMPTDPTKSLASMGIYVFDAAHLYELLEEDDRNENSSHDFGKDIIPKITEAGMAYAHPFLPSCVQFDPGTPSRTGATWGRWKPTEGQPRSGVSHAGVGYVRPELADPYPYGTPPASLQDRSGSHGMTPELVGFRGGIIPGRWWCSRCCSRAGKPHSVTLIRQSCCQMSGWASCRLRRCVIDRACVIPEGMVIGENAEEDARRFSIAQRKVSCW
ncbi:hypothetical protein MJ579_26780 [Klebsiella pneumoniae]|nr:hypothetical protein MJ579_26780 [Klebsiella pneumoniae]